MHGRANCDDQVLCEIRDMNDTEECHGCWFWICFLETFVVRRLCIELSAYFGVPSICLIGWNSSNCKPCSASGCNRQKVLQALGCGWQTSTQHELKWCTKSSTSRPNRECGCRVEQSNRSVTLSFPQRTTHNLRCYQTHVHYLKQYNHNSIPECGIAQNVLGSHQQESALGHAGYADFNAKVSNVAAEN